MGARDGGGFGELVEGLEGRMRALERRVGAVEHQSASLDRWARKTTVGLRQLARLVKRLLLAVTVLSIAVLGGAVVVVRGGQ
jgi:hypothetical protein